MNKKPLMMVKKRVNTDYSLRCLLQPAHVSRIDRSFFFYAGLNKFYIRKL